MVGILDRMMNGAQECGLAEAYQLTLRAVVHLLSQWRTRFMFILTNPATAACRTFVKSVAVAVHHIGLQ